DPCAQKSFQILSCIHRRAEDFSMLFASPLMILFIAMTLFLVHVQGNIIMDEIESLYELTPYLQNLDAITLRGLIVDDFCSTYQLTSCGDLISLKQEFDEFLRESLWNDLFLDEVLSGSHSKYRALSGMMQELEIIAEDNYAALSEEEKATLLYKNPTGYLWHMIEIQSPIRVAALISNARSEKRVRYQNQGRTCSSIERWQSSRRNRERSA
ncbi:hypothetical protein PENTCL1PPCAC_5726, partial [Pristionchus entomophagus]